MGVAMLNRLKGLARALPLAMAIALSAAVLPAAAQTIAQEPVVIPATFGSSQLLLEGMVVRPNGPGPYPVVVMNHGAPRDSKERATMAPEQRVPQAHEFAKRGWAVLVFMRRGYGKSQGEFAESSGNCNNPDYVKSGEQSAEDIRQAIKFVARQPWADAKRIVSVGQSAGGLATVALTANPPPGLVAAISFAGGRGSRGDNDICQADRLADAFGIFGRTSRIPMLWVYTENDLYFWPALARQMHQAFTRSGGKAELVILPPFGKDGHTLFPTSDAIPIWTPLVDRFLAEQRLTARAPSLPRPVAPAALSSSNRQSFDKYLAAPANKAFAIGSDGAFGWKSGQKTPEEAINGAMETCTKFTKRQCRLAYVNETPAE